MIDTVYVKLNAIIFFFPGLDDRPNKVDGSCLSEQGYEIPNRNPNTVGWGAEYNIRIRKYTFKQY